jgi:hypothetical protein
MPKFEVFVRLLPIKKAVYAKNADEAVNKTIIQLLEPNAAEPREIIVVKLK